AQQLDEPLAHDLLDDRRGRAAGIETGVLVPGRGEPVRRQRGGHRTPDDEAEVASARDSDDAVAGRLRKLLDDGDGIARALRERPAERFAHLLDGRLRPDRALVERVEEVACELRGALEKLALAHAARSFSNRSGSSYGPMSAR